MNWIPSPVLCLEAAIVIALLGALVVSQLRDSVRAWRVGLLFAGAVLGCSTAACLAFYAGAPVDGSTRWCLVAAMLGTDAWVIDELNAPLLPVVGLIHFLTALATGRTQMRRFSLAWSLTSAAIRLAIFGSAASWILIYGLILSGLPPLVELRNRGKSTRIYLLHMLCFSGLLAVGWAFVDPTGGHQEQTAWATVPLLLAILIRCGAAPLHCWLTDWFEHASFGNALLFVTPLVGVYAAVRLVMPIAPDWVLQSISFVSLFTAVYAAGMAVVQRDARRLFAYLFLSHASLVLVGLEMHTLISLTGALALWVSVSLSLAGFGLTLRALEARFGRLTLMRFHGLYDHSPTLAICFLLTGLTCIGFPGTLGFVAGELLVDDLVQANVFIGLVVVLAGALNGIAVLRAYFQLFTGARHVSSVSLSIGPRERFAVLTLTLLILGGGLFPQPGIRSRQEAATAILRERELRSPSQSPVAAMPQAEPIRLLK